jgi:hypothetical protein
MLTMSTYFSPLPSRQCNLADVTANIFLLRYLRIVDESGEDYLYPESYFISVELPRMVQEALRIPG